MTHKTTTISKGPAGHIDIEQWSCAGELHNVEAGDGYTRLQARRVNRAGVDEVQIELKVGTFDKRLGLRAQYASLILNPAQAAELIEALKEKTA